MAVLHEVRVETPGRVFWFGFAAGNTEQAELLGLNIFDDVTSAHATGACLTSEGSGHALFRTRPKT